MLEHVTEAGLVALVGSGHDRQVHGDDRPDDATDQAADDDVADPSPPAWAQNPGAGIIGRPEELPAGVPDSWSAYVTVADCEATQTLTDELGGSVTLPATPTPMGPFAVLADPAGAPCQIMEMTSRSGA